MIRIIKTEIKKLKRSSILVVGISAIFACVILTRFMATASNAEEYTVSSGSVCTLTAECNAGTVIFLCC